ncbi:MAG TPA: leucyl/phenylalanyl-tRNA--protein transferase [Desulfobacterales bacterium]|nr:leucyl/phenylalanyl-tRNA--protein transferase [Desulfobacterales bacterium]
MSEPQVPVFLLSDTIEFPPPHLASEEGLLAVGGDLSQKRLLLAYRMGIFPWFSDNEPILWWSPDPRLVLYPGEIKVSKTLKKIIKKNVFSVTLDLAFNEVINQCAQVRLQQNQGTWIVKEMVDAYCNLHESGFAHSVEVWLQGELVGGLYGVSLGKCFFGESMFTLSSNASNVGLVKLVEYLNELSFDIIDCQVTTEHLIRFGAREISRTLFLEQLERSLSAPTKRGKWEYKI